ncbi:MAG: FAD-dependent oxidoreductase [Planctomycetes bacterium]|nr:FAD-dependent oxidoreductase [Planctomycetota bacterium]
MFSLTTTFDRDDFTRLLVERFGVPADAVRAFFDTARKMNFFDDQSTTNGQLFERFFPGREDVIRLLMEPITYANGSTLEDPAVSYGIVFSNFMSKGVFTFRGGTDRLIGLMRDDLLSGGVDVRIKCDVERILVRRGRVVGVQVGGRQIGAAAVVSNANLKSTIFKLVGAQHFDRKFAEDAAAVRLNNSSCQVYMALKPGVQLDENLGDLLFSSTAPLFRTELLLARNVTSRTFSFYYPRSRPGSNRSLIVSSTNARYQDWAGLSPDEYQASKRDLVETTLDALEKYIPNAREIIVHAEASTPRTFQHYTQHAQGASFGTKFEGLKVSFDVPKQIAGLYHAGSVGIIMSGWLGAMNYGRMVAGDVDNLLATNASRSTAEVGS